MKNVSLIYWGLLFGSIGLGFFTYGKKQQVVMPMLSGVGLMVFPYFVSNPYALVLTGLGLMVIPFFIRF